MDAFPDDGGPLRGFVVHAYADRRTNRMLLAGRLEDGRSFAASDSRFAPSLLVREADAVRARACLASASVSFSEEASPLEAFEDGGALLKFSFPSLAARWSAAVALRSAAVPSPDADLKVQDLYLLERGLRGPAVLSGPRRKGRWVDLVFSDPDPRPAPPDFRAPLRLLALDIETDEATRALRAASLAVGDGDSRPLALVRVVGRPVPGAPAHLRFHPDEASLLSAFAADLRDADPDVLTGWNVLDFDLPRLAERYAALGLPFAVGRSTEAARFLAGEGRRSAAAVVPGRQVLDALRAVRSGGDSFPDYSLETVSRAVLGEGKSLGEASAGEGKLEALDRLHAEDPAAFGEYCLRDSRLVLGILEKTGLFRLATERAALTGVTIDKAWTSVASFERVYAAGLRARSVAPAKSDPERRVSGAAGGTVLDSVSGLFGAVAVFDFRSLYPTIMDTFNLDPLSHERARAGGRDDDILAPNGARFRRDRGILPDLVASYFGERKKALDAGNAQAAHVYKILMNSFYGVLGTDTCRYARTELAGAVTSFARKWLLFTRDFLAARGYRVLYGDTDSVFVETGLDPDAPYGAYAELCGAETAALNAEIAAQARRDYGLESKLALRFDKAYRRFLIPPLRSLSAEDAPRGRAKGYAGLLLEADGSTRVEVKGMEAARRDSTLLARNAQLDLLARAFRGEGGSSLNEALAASAAALRRGELDGDLVYRKRLARPPEAYVSSTPPQVKAARALGWTNRRGTVSYVWTTEGPQPASARTAPYDYDHYYKTQLLPVAASIAAAAGWEVSAEATAQMELGF